MIVIFFFFFFLLLLLLLLRLRYCRHRIRAVDHSAHREAHIFFKQKTAYEILRSDWSSDVCSSD
eukprot:COSAG01_NODE_38611_length_487_cov_1.355670_2_plen_63_part_01